MVLMTSSWSSAREPEAVMFAFQKLLNQARVFQLWLVALWRVKNRFGFLMAFSTVLVASSSWSAPSTPKPEYTLPLMS